jgi:DNA polymerase IV
VERFHGIGPATTAKMSRLGIHTGLDLRAQPLVFLQEQFGKAGAHYYWIARGIDERPVRPDRIRKSIGAENTFADDLVAFDAMIEALQPILDKVWRHSEGAGARGRTVTLKVKYADFQQITRSRTLADPVASHAELARVSLDLLSALMPVPKGVRLLGVTLSSLAAEETPGMCQMRLPL